MRSTKIYFAALIAGLLCSCITEYEADGVDSITGVLVVDATITNGETTVTLTRGVALTEEYYNPDSYVDNATVSVVCNDGSRFEAAASAGKGAYTIATGEISPANMYKLSITIDGEAYESEYLTPLITPAIDKISCLKEGEGKPVYICVSTHDTGNTSPYYRWQYQEHWEVKSELFSQARFYQDNTSLHYFYVNDLQSSSNTYYCWGKDNSKSYIIESTTKLSDNIISNKKLVGIPASDDKLSVLYYISVAQYQIRKEAYEYYSNVQKNIEQTGSIFSPMPSEVRGNVRCLSDPERLVIGYVEVATQTTLDRFVDVGEGYFEPQLSNCILTAGEGRPADWGGYTIYEFEQGQGQGPEGTAVGKVGSHAARRCLDCRTRGTKEKPAFWPNDHL